MLDDLIKSPENKIKSVSKILDTTSSDVNKTSTVLNKTLLETRSIQKQNFNVLKKILSPETSQAKESPSQINRQNIQRLSSQEPPRQQPSEVSPSSDNTTPDTGPGTINPAMPFSIASGTRFNKMQDISSTVSPGGAGSFFITDTYGSRGGGHKGIDIGGPIGTYIALKADCEVLSASSTIDNSGFGKWISVWVPSQGIQLLMGHCNDVFITNGKIPAGKSFATLGSTGKSSGPHIHFQYSNSKNVFASDGPPDQYVGLLYLTRNKSAGFAPQRSSVNTPPRARQNLLTPKPNQQLKSMIIPQQMQPSQPVLIEPSIIYDDKFASNKGTSLNMIMALAKYS